MSRRPPDATREIVESIRDRLRARDYAAAAAIAETIDEPRKASIPPRAYEPPATTDRHTEQASTVGERFRNVFEPEAEP